MKRLAAAPPVALLSAALLAGMSACTSTDAPVTARRVKERPEVVVFPAGPTARDSKRRTHTVARGDTLYSIAWRYGRDYRDLAAWNGIGSSFTIYPGQVIHLRKRKTRSRPAPAPRTTARDAAPGKQAAPPRRTAARPAPAVPPPGPVRWQWPARGKVLKAAGGGGGRQGIGIAGRTGQRIVAAAPGAVVYSGGGLQGYGKLIIIKHNATYLSAYGYNRRLMVKEGEQVRAGQQIATMGLNSRGAPVLHFEIRKDGRPIDPLGQLPAG